MLKGVLFDLDDTLLDWSGFKQDWPVLERQHLRGVVDYLRTDIHLVVDFDAYCAEFGNRMLASWTLARTTMRAPNLGSVLMETSVAFGAPAETLDVHRCLEAYKWCAIPGTRIFPEVMKTLTLLQQHHLKIGIVTNAHQPMWLRDIELRDHKLFDFFPTCRIAAADIGYLKPHPSIFQAGLRCLGTRPEETVFVGDDIEADIGGAKSAGMTTIYRRLGRHTSLIGPIMPDATITALDQVPAVLDARYPGWRDA